MIVLILLGWGFLYARLESIAHFLTYSILLLPSESALSSAIEFFMFDTPKVLLLLSLIVFFVAILRTFVTPERTRRLLSGKRLFVGNILAAMLGIVTPFCSCSAIPLFLGFVESGVPLGVTFSFLIAAPMINEVAVVLLFGMFGLEVALIYIGSGLSIAILAGWIIGHLGLEKYVESWVYDTHVGPAPTIKVKHDITYFYQEGKRAVIDIINRIWFYIVLGIAVGAGIHGYVPTGMMASFMGKDVWWSVPAAVVLGVPMYSNAAGIIPIVEALLAKGAALGTALAFMMAVIALSLPEIIILRKVLKPRLIAIFIAVVATGITLLGYLYNYII